MAEIGICGIFSHRYQLSAVGYQLSVMTNNFSLITVLAYSGANLYQRFTSHQPSFFGEIERILYFSGIFF
uniref:Uncharacterized protein n=1 Tax=Tolypothrix bouteillei VB521301 TaxID=1479485 RepID=A0A0C1N5W3_9CYAN